MSIYISILSLTKTAEVETVILKWILTGSGNIAFDKVSGSTVVQRYAIVLV